MRQVLAPTGVCPWGKSLKSQILSLLVCKVCSGTRLRGKNPLEHPVTFEFQIAVWRNKSEMGRGVRAQSEGRRGFDWLTSPSPPPPRTMRSAQTGEGLSLWWQLSPWGQRGEKPVPGFVILSPNPSEGDFICPCCCSQPETLSDSYQPNPHGGAQTDLHLN